MDLAIADEVQEKSQQQKQLSLATLAELKKAAKDSLYVFAKGILGYSWLDLEIHGPLCENLQHYRENNRLMFVLPRGWYKTTLCSISYPMWRAVNNPDIRQLIAQNTMTNALAKLSSIDSHFKQNELFKSLYPEILPTKANTWRTDSMTVNRPHPAAEGTFEAAGIRTQVVSRHYDVIIEDDTVAPDLSDLGEENIAPTKEDIGQAIGWHRLVPPLLVDQKESQNLIVGTRWFELDLISWVKENQKHFKIYTRAARENELGEPDTSGHVAFPARFDDDTLRGLEADMGPYMYSCLYMNMPIASDNMLFQLSWFNWYETPPANLYIYTTVDLAGDPNVQKSKGKDSDYNVVMTCGKNIDTGDIYVLDYSRFKGSPGQLLNELFRHVKLYDPLKVGIETVQYQSALIYFVNEKKKETGLSFPVEPMTHNNRSKEVRIRGLQPVFADKKVHLRTWMKDLQTELLTFPYGKHDDLPDTLSMQLPLWQRTRTAKKRKEYHDPHVLDFDAARTELHGRKTKTKGLLDDILKPVSKTEFRFRNGSLVSGGNFGGGSYAL